MKAAEGLPVTEKALEIFYSNRIAHTCRDVQKKILVDMFTEKNEEYMGYQTLMHHFTSKEIETIAKTAHRYFVAESNMNTKASKIAKAQLGRYRVGEEEIDYLRKKGYGILAKEYVNFMAIKDEAIAESISLLKEDETQSFGLAKTTDSKNGREEDLFVIDVPCFGQMSVHIYDRDLITSLSDNEYKYPICNRNNVLLIDRTSEYQESFMKQDTPELIDSLRRLKSRREAHEIAVKVGFEKEELKALYETKDEGDGR